MNVIVVILIKMVLIVISFCFIINLVDHSIVLVNKIEDIFEVRHIGADHKRSMTSFKHFVMNKC